MSYNRPNIYTTDISLEWSEAGPQSIGDTSHPRFVLTGGSTKLFIPFFEPPTIDYRSVVHSDLSVRDVRLANHRGFVFPEGRIEIDAGLPDMFYFQKALEILEQRILITLFPDEDNA